MSVRCKMQLVEVTQSAWSTQSRVMKFRAVYDQAIPEDQRFARATPSAELTMTVDNPGAVDQLTLGTFFYVDFTPAPSE